MDELDSRQTHFDELYKNLNMQSIETEMFSGSNKFLIEYYLLSLISNGVISYFDSKEVILKFKSKHDSRVFSFLDDMLKNCKGRLPLRANKPRIYD